MNLKDRNVVVTGGASGIGRALCRRFAREGANVVVADLDLDAANRVAAECRGLAVRCDVGKESDIKQLVASAEQCYGPVDLFCSNAGLFFGEAEHSASAANAAWQTSWEVHVMAHVYAARAVLPAMIERGEGYLVNVASAAGLLSQIGDAAYSATKHAAVGFAESLSITHHDDGIRVSVVCPQYVATPMLGYGDDETGDVDGVISPADLADTVLEGIAQERFLILPHPQVADYIRHKGADYDRWIGGMRKLRRKVVDKAGSVNAKDVFKLV